MCARRSNPARWSACWKTGANRFPDRFCITPAVARRPPRLRPSSASSVNGGSGSVSLRRRPGQASVSERRSGPITSVRSLAKYNCQSASSIYSAVRVPARAGTTALARLEHAGQHAIRWLVIVEEGADVDDHLLAHLDAAFDGGRAHMRQQRHLAGLGEPHQFRADRRLVLEYVEASAGDLARLDQLGQRFLVDHLAARSVDDVGVLADQF